MPRPKYLREWSAFTVGRSTPNFWPSTAPYSGVEVERIVREDRQASDAVADPVVGRLQRGLAQVLLVGRLQHVLGNIAGARHDQIAVVHRLGHDHGHQAVSVGDLLGIARLQRRQRQQEPTLLVHKAEHIGYVAERQLLVERLLARSMRKDVRTFREDAETPAPWERD